MKTFICKEFRFEAAHQLPFHKGKCARNHGHSYKLQVCFSGKIRERIPGSFGEEQGMVMDFERINKLVKPIIESILDHYSLNDLMENPTAELIAAELFRMIHEIMKRDIPYPDVKLESVKLWETDNSFVEIRR